MSIFPRPIILALLGLALAACDTTQDVNLESRDFTVQQTSSPAADSVADTERIARLVRASGPTYVTLVVSETDGPSTDSKDKHRGVAVTSGSGFVVDHAGHIMTAAHVAVHPGNTVQARAANGRVYSGKVVATLPANDMALIKLRGFSGKPVTPAANRCLAKGSMVYSPGRPHAQADTARIGQLESQRFGRPVSYGRYGYPDAMVLRLSTQKGESGGPLFNGSGDLVGMVVSTLYDGNGKPLNLAHAIPLETLADFLCGNSACERNWQAISTPSGCPGA